MFEPITEYFRRFNVSGQTVLHVGAHYGEEDPLYSEFDMEPIYVEADNTSFAKLSSKLPRRKKHNIAISNKKGKFPFHVANNQKMSSSLLDMKDHCKIWPGVGYTNTIDVECTTIDDLIDENNYDINALFLDIQDGEMNALLGAKNILKHIDFLIMEIHLIPLYNGESLLPDFDTFLNTFNLKRVVVGMTHEIEGDVLYINRDFLRKINNISFNPDPCKIVQIPDLGDIKAGRFGNQLLLYSTAKGYCQTYGYTLEIPEHWMGRKIFKNINDNTIKEELPDNSRTRNRCQNGEFNIKLKKSWSLCQDSISYFTKREIKHWLELKDEYKIEADKTKSIVAHLRRGDYLHQKHLSHFASISKRCYKKAIEQFGYRYEDVHFIQEPYYSPGHFKWINRDELSFLHDFQTIQNADVIFRANSTFSWCAAALSNARIFSPLVGNTVGWQDNIQFAEGNYPSIVHKDNHNHKQWFTDMHLYEYE